MKLLSKIQNCSFLQNILLLHNFSISDYYWSSDVNINHLEQFSNTFYPDLYCGCVELAEKACYEQNILELWGDQVLIIQSKISFIFILNDLNHVLTISKIHNVSMCFEQISFSFINSTYLCSKHLPSISIYVFIKTQECLKEKIICEIFQSHSICLLNVILS